MKFLMLQIVRMLRYSLMVKFQWPLDFLFLFYPGCILTCHLIVSSLGRGRSLTMLFHKIASTPFTLHCDVNIWSSWLGDEWPGCLCTVKVSKIPICLSWYWKEVGHFLISPVIEWYPLFIFHGFPGLLPFFGPQRFYNSNLFLKNTFIFMESFHKHGRVPVDQWHAHKCWGVVISMGCSKWGQWTREVYRRIPELPNSSCIESLNLELGLCPISVILKARRIGYLHYLVDHQNNEMLKRFFKV
jgi:hypothetical protein